jgi:hypothetical protein
MKKTNSIFFLFSVLLLSAISLKSSTCVSLGNGNWTNPAMWSCGHVPTCGDSMVILSTHTIVLDNQQDYTGCAQGPIVVVYGTMQCQNGNKLKLPCNSRIYIMPGGQVQAGNGSGSSNYIEICDVTLWNAGMGNLYGPSCLPATSFFCGSVTLPIELLEFKGQAKDGYIDLSWKTASESNSSHFDVERSTDASLYQKINTVNSKATNGYSQSLLSYNSTDPKPEEDISYYRLRQVDKDNTFLFSNVISINYIRAKNIKFAIYPNPNSGEFTADITGLENNHEVKIILRDLAGSLLFESSFYTSENKKNIQIVPQSKLKSGIYICSLYLEEIEYKVKVIVNAAG